MLSILAGRNTTYDLCAPFQRLDGICCGLQWSVTASGDQDIEGDVLVCLFNVSAATANI
jgi:hypothetical protein